MAGIECGSTGRYFGSLEAVEECSRSHNHCSTCPYKQNQPHAEIHFIAKDKNKLTQLELEKLMAEINAHLKAQRPMGGIECGATGRYFGSLEAVEECSRSHNHCSTCPYKQNQPHAEIHFITKDRNKLTQLELEKLMAKINAHLKAQRLKVPQSVFAPRRQDRVKQPRVSPQFKSKPRGKRVHWLWILLIIIALALIIATIILGNTSQ